MLPFAPPRDLVTGIYARGGRWIDVPPGSSIRQTVDPSPRAVLYAENGVEMRVISDRGGRIGKVLSSTLDGLDWETLVS